MRKDWIAGSVVAVAAVFAGCERAQPESVASEPAGEAQPQDPSVRYLANEGVLLSLPEGTVLIDGLFRDGLPEYPVVEGATRDSLERGLGVFGDIDLVLVTHVHRDHFNALAVERHLIENPRAHLVASRQVADSVRILGSEYARIEARVHPVDATPGWIEELEVAGIFVRALGIAHPPSRNQPVGHLAYVVGREGGVAHLGDLGLELVRDRNARGRQGSGGRARPVLDPGRRGERGAHRGAARARLRAGLPRRAGEGESAREWLTERAPEARLLTEPSTIPIADCAGSP